MALRLSEIFWLYQPIGHDPLNQLPAMIFPKSVGDAVQAVTVSSP